MAATYRLLVKHARQIVMVCDKKQKMLRGKDMQNLVVLTRNDSSTSTGFSIVVDDSGRITAIGADEEINATFAAKAFACTIDATNMCIIPGLVDGHTHPVWAGDRVNEFRMKLRGASYMDIHAMSGGINYTVKCTRAASEEDLYKSFRKRINLMIQSGTTLLEAKSGYGLDVDSEVKMLRVIQRGKNDLPIDIVATFCGAHSIPQGMTMEEATNDVIAKQIPAVQKLVASGSLQVDNIDVFCEKGVFDTGSSAKILRAGKDAGLQINFHGDELHPVKSAEMGAEVGAKAISHLEMISLEGIDAMAKNDIVAVVLPTTAYILRLTPPPVRQMIDKEVVVALGSDFNPNAFCLSMPLVMHLACIILKMSMEEALVASTINAAASLGRSDRQGSLEVGKLGDMVIIDALSWDHIVYQMGNHQSLIQFVIKEGTTIYSKGSF